MKRLSLRRMGESTERAMRRFPLVLIAAVVAAVAGVVMVESPDEQTGIDLLMTAQLGIPLFLAIALAAGRRQRGRPPRHTGLILSLLGIGVLALFRLTRTGQVDDADVILFLQLNVGFHLLVAVLPFAGRGENRGMWQFNVTLLLRFITAAFFSAVLFGGLSVALVALDKLLGVHLDDEIYAELWFVIAFVFNTAYVLGGIPERLSDLDRADTYPRVLRVFAQYILAPLVTVYLAILTAYLVKVVATGEWPSGWIGWLVSSVAAAGILSLLLLMPESGREDRRWLRTYARVYFWLMLPAVAMLALAILKRIDQYGVTEKRYFLLVLTAWLAAVVVTGCLRRRLLFKAIPATLCALAFLTAIGPWSDGAVSHRSQLARLEGLLVAHSRLVEGVIVPDAAEVPAADGNEIQQLLRYLFRQHGAGALDDLASAELQAALAVETARFEHRASATHELVATTTTYMNLTVIPLSPEADPRHHSFRRVHLRAALPVAAHDFVIPIRQEAVGDHRFDLAGEPCRLEIDWEARTLTVVRDEESLLVLPLDDLIVRLRRLEEEARLTTVADAELVVFASGAAASGELHIDEISWDENGVGDVERGHLDGSLLLTVTEELRRHRE